MQNTPVGCIGICSFLHCILLEPQNSYVLLCIGIYPLMHCILQIIEATTLAVHYTDKFIQTLHYLRGAHHRNVASIKVKNRATKALIKYEAVESESCQSDHHHGHDDSPMVTTEYKSTVMIILERANIQQFD